MSSLVNVIFLFFTLFICVLNVYSMISYRLPEKKAYGCFAVVTVLCLAVNSYIAVCYGQNTLQSVILFTIGLPYFVLILFITKDRISQTVFNFWLWINIYSVIANFSMFISDVTFKNHYFMSALRFLLFILYFVVYNKYLKNPHRILMEKLKVNWWVFSFIPLCFTVLIFLVNHYFKGFYGLKRNYPVLLAIYILMLAVYILMFYTFKTVHDSMEKRMIAHNMRKQVILQKEQYRFQMEKAEAERIFRHDARHRDTILLSYLNCGDIEGAKEFLRKEVAEIQTNAKINFCGNTLVNAVLTEYQTKAQKKGLDFFAHIQIPETLVCDEAEFCVMLANLLENSLEAAISYIEVKIIHFNHQLSLNVKNDYHGELQKDLDGWYLSTKRSGSGLGLKSIHAILKNNQGFLRIDDKNGVFDVYATLKMK